MTRFPARLAVGMAGAGAVALASVLVAPSAVAAPTAQDVAFMKANEQTNLAEITLGNLALKRASSATARSVATKTIADHQAAKAKLTALAGAAHVTLPTAPNATQQSQAATLKTVSASKFDLSYLQVQVVGHTMSIAATNKEISSGSDAKTIAYARFYLPVATMHLKMARDGVATLGGAPSGVPAGSGGQASTTSSSQLRTEWAGAAAGMLVVLLGGFGLIRRRRPVSS
jgi:putative membrane protein